MDWVYFDEFVEWVWLVFVKMMPTIHVFHGCFSLLSIIPCLCCVVHFMLMVKCLIDISFISMDSMVYNVLSLAGTSITYAYHMHQCCTCLNKCHVFFFFFCISIRLGTHYYIFGSLNMFK